jgi:hypothetical protein
VSIFSRCRGFVRDIRRVFDSIIGFIATYTFTTRDYRKYSAIADLHTLHFTVTSALGFSVFTNRIMATDFVTVSPSLQITHKVFLSQPNFFLAIILQLPIPKTPINSIILCSQAHTPAGWRPETRLFTSRLLFYSAEHVLITTLHGPLRKHNLLFYSAEHFLITTLHGPHRKHSLHC